MEKTSDTDVVNIVDSEFTVPSKKKISWQIPHEKSEYDQIRDQNIKEREEKFEELFGQKRNQPQQKKTCPSCKTVFKPASMQTMCIKCEDDHAFFNIYNNS